MTIEQLEGNKLIAKFDGGIECFNQIRFGKHPTEELGNYYNYNDLLYHSSWDWLIPVIEKIESIKDDYHGHFAVYIGGNMCTIQSTNFRPDKRIPERPHYFNCITLDTKIESTFCMIVRFIKWHNKKNKNEK